MNTMTTSRTSNRKDRPGKIFHAPNVESRGNSHSTPPDRPRVSSSTNDNQYVTQLDSLLLAGSPTSETKDTCTVKLHVVNSVPTAPGHSQKKEISPGAAVCQPYSHKLKYVNSASCVIPLSYVNVVRNAPNVASNLPVGARLQNFWQKWLHLGAGPKVVQILREGYTLPFRTRPKLSRVPTVVSCYGNPRRNLKLLEALHQLTAKKCYRTGKQTDLPGVLQPIIPGSQTQQQMEANPGLEQSKPFSQNRKIQDGNSGNHQNLSPTRTVGNLHRLQGCLFPRSHTGTVKEILEISRPGTDLSVQSSPLRPINSSHGVHCHSKGGKTYGHSEGYKAPPIPRRLVGESHLPPGLSPAYTRPSTNVQGFRLAGEHREVGIGTQTNFQFRRLPVRPPVRSGSTDTGQVAKPTGKDTRTHLPTGLFSAGTDVPNRTANRDGETSPPRQTSHEAHSVAPQKKLENTGIPTQTDPTAQISAPSLTMVAAGRQRSHRPAITPATACSANLYRRIKRRVGRSLKRVYCT